MMDLAAEYNNRALVPDHPQIIAGWHEKAAAYRAARQGEFDIRYGARPRNLVDVFPGSGKGALVVFIHGGYWRSLDKSAFSHVAGPANAAGFDVALPTYTLCPEVSIADIVDEVRQCCLFLFKRYGRKLVVTGHSAGGHLAAEMAATEWSHYGAPSDLIQACLSISGLFDLRPLICTPLNDDLRLTPAAAIASSPLLRPMKSRLPFDSWVGGDESFEFLRQARSLAAAWAGEGLSCRYQAVPGHNHFSIGDLLSQAGQPMTGRLLELAAG